MTTSVVEPRPCKTCGEPANYIGYGEHDVTFCCAAGHISNYYDDEPDALAVDDALTGKIVPGVTCSAGHPADGIIYSDYPPDCGCQWWPAAVVIAPPDVSLALAEHTAHALNTLSGTPDPTLAGSPAIRDVPAATATRSGSDAPSHLHPDCTCTHAPIDGCNANCPLHAFPDGDWWGRPLSPATAS